MILCGNGLRSFGQSPAQSGHWQCGTSGSLVLYKRTISEFFVAPHERWHYIFIRFWKVPMEAAIFFAGFVPGLVRLGLFALCDCMLLC